MGCKYLILAVVLFLSSVCVLCVVGFFLGGFFFFLVGLVVEILNKTV